MSQNCSALFRGRHFEDVIIILCVRWYLRYSLSYRDLEEMMAERGLSVDHVTVWCWVQHYAPILNQRLRRELRRPTRSWRVDETYVRVAGKWAYLYRAVDSSGDTIDFMLSPKRDLTAAKLFLRLALSGTGGIRPRVINVDGHPAYARAIAELKRSGDLSRRCRCRPSPGSIGSGTSVSFENMACRVCDRSDSPIDVRHTMTSNAIYELPFGRGRRYLNSNGLLSNLFGGWQLSGLATASTGRPVNFTIKRKPGALLDGNTSSQRPDLVPGQSIYAANQTIDNWFNPAAFAVPASGTWGDVGRNIGRGPGYYEIDTALQKKFRLTERFALNFRAEAFNLFNHPIYDNPSGNTSSGGFGQITSVLNAGAVGTGTPRRYEFAMRLDF